MIVAWYVLENGQSADPNEVAPDATGRLVHSSGVPVAVGPHGPRSRGVYPDAERAKQATKAKRYATREMKANP